MHKGVPMASHQSRSVLSVLLLIHFCQAAPGQPGAHKEEESVTALANPFHPGDEDRRLLQSYIDSILNKDGQAGAEIITWEQEVFFLFRLYDFDRSGLLDGLEMIKLLSDYNAHKSGVVQFHNEVVSMVDFLLQTQDLNHDGLFSPSELLSPPLVQKQHGEAAEDHNEMVQEEMKLQIETKLQDEERPVEDIVVVVEEQHAHQAPEVPMTEEKETIGTSVHRGQPEI